MSQELNEKQKQKILNDQPRKNECEHCKKYKSMGATRCPFCKRILRIYR